MRWPDPAIELADGGQRRGQHSRHELDLSKVDWSRVDATTEDEIIVQVAEDDDAAPIFTAEEILAAGRRISPRTRL